MTCCDMFCQHSLGYTKEARVEAGRPPRLFSSLDDSDGGGEKCTEARGVGSASGLDMRYESK